MAFSPRQPPQSPQTLLFASTTTAPTMNEIDTMCLMNTATHCIREECSLEDQEALLNTLEDQSHSLEHSLENLRSLITALATKVYTKEVPHIRTSNRMSDIDRLCIENAASFCVTEECSMDDKEAIVNRLTEESHIVQYDLTDMLILIKRLKAAMAARHDKNIDSLMESIQSALSLDLENAQNEKILSGSF